MNVLRVNDPHYSKRLSQVTAASSLFDPEIEQAARGIVDAVYTRGDAAVLELIDALGEDKISPRRRSAPNPFVRHPAPTLVGQRRAYLRIGIPSLRAVAGSLLGVRS